MVGDKEKTKKLNREDYPQFRTIHGSDNRLVDVLYLFILLNTLSPAQMAYLLGMHDTRTLAAEAEADRVFISVCVCVCTIREKVDGDGCKSNRFREICEETDVRNELFCCLEVRRWLCNVN